MKRILTVLVCMAMAATACNKASVEAPSVSDAQTLTVSASLPLTRLAVDKGKVTWTEGDQIAVYNSSGSKFVLTLAEGAGTNFGKFSGTFDGTLNTNIAVYPAAYAGDNAGEVVIPSFEKRTDGIPAVMASALEVSGSDVNATCFHHLMAVMEFTLEDIPAYACAFKLWSKEGIQLSGTYTVNSSLDGVSGPVGSSETKTSSHVLHFPYKTGYGSDGNVKFYFPVPAFDYTDLAVRVIDGDEDVISGTGIVIPAASASLKAGDYVAMPALNVRKLVGDKRDKFVKVEGIKWAKGNLRAWKSGPQGDGWQDGWNIYDNQWESQYLLVPDPEGGKKLDGSSENFSLNTSLYKETVGEASVYTHWDYFSWGTIGRASRVHNQPVICTVSNFEISGKVFNTPREGSSAIDISTFEELTGDSRFVPNAFDDSNPQISGDLAFWASKGQYRMPTKGEVQKLYAKNFVGQGDGYAHMQAGYYMVDGKKINGILFTSCPSWETTTYETTAIELTDADMESGLFLPKIGERTTNKDPNTYNATGIMYFNSWGAYWSGTYGGLNSGFEDCAVHIFFTSSNAMNYGYTGTPSKTISGQTILGNAIRPVYLPAQE